MDGHAAFQRENGGTEGDVAKINGRGFTHDPAPTLTLEVDGRGLFGVGPHGSVGVVGGKFESEGLVEMRQGALKEPGLFGQEGVRTLFVLVSNDSAGIAGGRFRDAHLVVLEEMAFTVAVLGHLAVFDGVLVAVRADAPDVHGENFGVLVEGDGDDALAATLGTDNFEDVAVMLDC